VNIDTFTEMSAYRTYSWP